MPEFNTESSYTACSTNPWKIEKEWDLEKGGIASYSQGLDPSAMSNNLKELKLTSLWSLVANKPQWRSLDLHIATLAEIHTEINVFLENHHNFFKKKTDQNKSYL